MYKHGADLEKVKRKYHIKGELVDFSSNVNPFTPENTLVNIMEKVDVLRKYPDIEYLDLRNKIAEHIVKDNKCDFVFNQANVCVGNGSTELVYLFLSMVKGSVGVICPTFSEYRRAASILGKNHIEIQMIQGDHEFLYPDLDDCELDKYKELDTLFVCNPNNPDGKLRNLDNIVDFCQKNNIKLVVDETFIEFADDYKKYTALNYKYQDIFVIRAITKFYGLPGIRLGYMISRNSAAIEKLFRVKPPWTVNSLASTLGPELFKDEKFRVMTRKFYHDEREFLKREIAKIDCLTAFDTDTAFILIKIDDKCGITASELRNRLIFDYGILIRDASNFLGLNSRFFRVAIKRHNDNLLLIEGLKEIFN